MGYHNNASVATSTEEELKSQKLRWHDMEGPLCSCLLSSHFFLDVSAFADRTLA